MNQFLKLCIDNRAALAPVEKRELFMRNDVGQTLYIRGPIADGFEANAADITAALGMADPSQPLTVVFNTPGGDVFEGKEIAVALRDYPGHTIANIVSLCASAGSWIAIECKEVVMQKGAFFMIHNAKGMAYGDKKAFRDRADLMEKVEHSIIDSYVAKTGKSSEDIANMMDVETWMTADEALENGFVDRVASGGSVSNMWNLSAYSKAPVELATPTDIAAPAVEPAPEPKNEAAPCDAPAAVPAAAEAAPEPAPEPLTPAPSMAQSNRNRLALLQATP